MLGETGLREVPEPLRTDVRELDQRPPELADEPEGDFLVLALAKESPASLIKWDPCHVRKRIDFGGFGGCSP